MVDGENTGMFGSFSFLIKFGFTSSLLLFTVLFSYVLMFNYGFSSIYDIAESLDLSGRIHESVLTIMDSIIGTLRSIPEIIDLLWFASFIIVVIDMFYIAYRAHRETEFSIFSYLTYGMMFLFFLMSIFVNFSDWIQAIFTAVLPTLSLQTPLFSFYLANIGKINLAIIVACLILNYVDFDYAKFFQRKNKETINDEY